MSDTQNKDAWLRYKGDFNALDDEEIMRECDRAQNEIDEAEDWLEAVASWCAAGKPRVGQYNTENTGE